MGCWHRCEWVLPAWETFGSLSAGAENPHSRNLATPLPDEEITSRATQTSSHPAFGRRTVVTEPGRPSHDLEHRAARLTFWVEREDWRGSGGRGSGIRGSVCCWLTLNKIICEVKVTCCIWDARVGGKHTRTTRK